MRELNIEFQEQYKSLDKLCRDMYSSNDGVSAYIRDMENSPSNYSYSVYSWDDTYRQLKHARWMRNQLAHDTPIDACLCTQNDIDWLKSFYDAIFNGTDPLTLAHKADRPTRRIIYTKKESPTAITENTEQNTPQSHAPKQSLWQRFKSKIKSWFA